MKTIASILEIVRTLTEILLFGLGVWVLWRVYVVFLYRADPLP